MIRRRLVGGIVAAAAVVLVGAGPAAAARADTVDGGTPGLLTVDADLLPLDLDLDPGMSGSWLLTPHLAAPTDSLLDVTIESSGPLARTPGGLTIAIDECDVPWSTAGAVPDCTGAETARMAATSFAAIPSGEWMPFGELDDGQSRYLRVTIALPDPAPAELQGASAEFSVGFTAAGDQEVVRSPGGDPQLGRTGVAVALPLAVALALGVAGVVVRSTATRRRS